MENIWKEVVKKDRTDHGRDDHRYTPRYRYCARPRGYEQRWTAALISTISTESKIRGSCVHTSAEESNVIALVEGTIATWEGSEVADIATHLNGDSSEVLGKRLLTAI